jgi:hypothetical protein
LQDGADAHGELRAAAAALLQTKARLRQIVHGAFVMAAGANRRLGPFYALELHERVVIVCEATLR